MSVCEEVTARLRELNIPFELVQHEPIYTMEECGAVASRLAGVIPKNLFLKPRRAEVHYLLIMRGEIPFRAAEVSRQVNSPRLGFAGEEALLRLLRVHPGSVSPMGLLFDRENEVTLLVDEALRREKRLLFHPCDNCFTLAMGGEDFFERFLPACGHAPQFVTVGRAEE